MKEEKRSQSTSCVREHRRLCECAYTRVCCVCGRIHGSEGWKGRRGVPSRSTLHDDGLYSRKCQVSRHRRTTPVTHPQHIVTRYLLLNFLPGNLAPARISHIPPGHYVYGSIESETKLWGHVSVNFIWMKEFDIARQKNVICTLSWASRLDVEIFPRRHEYATRSIARGILRQICILRKWKTFYFPDEMARRFLYATTTILRSNFQQ